MRTAGYAECMTYTVVYAIMKNRRNNRVPCIFGR